MEYLTEISKALTLRKKRFLEVYRRNPVSISQAAKQASVPRRTVYNWLKRDLQFKTAFQMSNVELNDFAEWHLLQAIGKGSVRAILFYLKTRHPEFALCKVGGRRVPYCTNPICSGILKSPNYHPGQNCKVA